MPAIAVISAGDRLRGFPEAVEALADAMDLTVGAVEEPRHCEFDDLILARVQTGRLDVDEKACS